MPSIFNARDADSYEQTMGRWSRRLAPLFIEHAGVVAGQQRYCLRCVCRVVVAQRFGHQASIGVGR